MSVVYWTCGMSAAYRSRNKGYGCFFRRGNTFKRGNHAYVYQVSLENHGVDFEGTSRVIFKADAEDTHCAFDMPIICRQMAKSSIR